MILGITGKSGVGKTTVGNFFAQRNWEVLNVDQIAHQLYRPYQRVWREVVKRFGEGILKTNDVIDRQKLRMIVFTPGEEAKKALNDLNQIVHPELRRKLKEDIYFLSKKNRNAVVVAALWKELDLFSLCDKVLLVKTEDTLAYDRLHKRDGTTLEAYEAINLSQSDPENPDFIVQNEGDFQSLYKQLNLVVNSL